MKVGFKNGKCIEINEDLQVDSIEFLNVLKEMKEEKSKFLFIGNAIINMDEVCYIK